MWQFGRVAAGIVVVACSQCIHGNVELDKYAVGRAIADCGVTWLKWALIRHPQAVQWLAIFVS